MRIVAGTFGGRVVRAPTGSATRPTSERVRQAIFNVLGSPPDDCHVLDLFAGSGAMGIEALSRGALHCHFVDSNRAAIATLRSNLTSLGIDATTSTVRATDAVRALAERPARPWHWVFIDPPYRTQLAAQTASALPVDSLTPDATVVIEFDRRNRPAQQLGALTMHDERLYGDTVVAYYRPG
jgi:16S rRNA (guanine966-N2)-methyltransferase